jgi:hypothetical protein
MCEIFSTLLREGQKYGFFKITVIIKGGEKTEVKEGLIRTPLKTDEDGLPQKFY